MRDKSLEMRQKGTLPSQDLRAHLLGLRHKLRSTSNPKGLPTPLPIRGITEDITLMLVAMPRPRRLGKIPTMRAVITPNLSMAMALGMVENMVMGRRLGWLVMDLMGCIHNQTREIYNSPNLSNRNNRPCTRSNRLHPFFIFNKWIFGSADIL